ncbi:MAG: sensor histidine kinase [Proteobacteria bacterium]|nr:MAG: sensor histidine kinase [Pseudomonadota bacterium]
MSVATDRFPDISKLSKMSQTLIQKSDKIEKLWAERVKTAIPSSRDLREPVLMNTFPTFIANLAEALTPDFPREDATENSTIAEAHGRERFIMTEFTLSQIVTEYILSRDIITEELDAKDELTKADIAIIDKSFILGIQASINSYAAIQEDLRRTFIATLSHDIRNPISTIKMASDLLREEMKPDGDTTELVSMISSNAEKADDLLVAVLNSSLAANHSRIKLHIEECCINEVVGRCVSQFRLRAKGRIVTHGEKIVGFWSVLDLVRSLDNLVSNAIKYGSKDQPIKIEVILDHERLVLSVHNSGDPIPKSEQDKIFLPYERSLSAQEGRDEGWGLGLPYVRAVAEAHGGSLIVDSSLALGTTFTIDIPIDGRKYAL